MTTRRFPPPWPVEETDACYIVRDANGQALAYGAIGSAPADRDEAQWQVLLDQLAHIGERDQLHDLGDDQRPRQRTRPVRTGQGALLRNPNSCKARK